MPIQFQCHGCQSPFSVPETMAGTQAKCNKCGAVVTIPRPSATTSKAAPQTNQPISNPRPLPQLDDPLLTAAMRAPMAGNPLTGGYVVPQSRAGGGSQLWIWLAAGGVAALLLLIAMGVGVTMALRRIKLPDMASVPNIPTVLPSPVNVPSANVPAPGLVSSPNRSANNFPHPNTPTSNGAGIQAQPGGSPYTGTSPARSAVDNNFSANNSGAGGAFTPPTAGSAPVIPSRASTGRRNPSNSSAAGSGSVLPSGSAEPEQPPSDSTASTPAPPAFRWEAKVDPPPQPLDYKKGKISVPFDSYSTDIVVPAGPSNFVLVTSSVSRNEIWQVLDLRTAKQIGQPVQGEINIRTNSLTFSPDGRYAAAMLSGRSEYTVGVWSFATGQLAHEIPVNNSSTNQLCFSGPHQLAIAYNPDYNRTAIGVWDLQAGVKKHEMSFSNDDSEKIARDSLGASPGGEYLTMITGGKLGVVDSQTGQAVGQALLPTGFSDCQGLAFSPDGEELALDVKCNSQRRLVILDFATGRIVLDHELDDSYVWYDGPRLEWMPDKSGILHRGHVLIDRATGNDVWTFPSTDGSPRRMIRPGEMLVKLAGGRGGKVLQTVELPLKDITKALEAVRAGGEAIDSILPPLTTPDLFSASVATLPNGFTQWAVQPDPAGSASRGLDRELLVAKEGESLKRLIFAGADTGKIVVQKELQPIVGVGGGRRGRKQMVVERYDVVSGSKGTSVEIPSIYHLVGASLSGNFALVGYSDEKSKADRIDVLGLAPKKHIAGWRPYSGEKSADDETSRSHRYENQIAVQWLSMVDDEHVITISTGGKLVNWKLPECKAAYYFEQFGTPLAMSPGRKYLAGVHDGVFRIFNAATGECVGDLESPATGVRAVRAVFRPDGRELAAVIDGGEDQMLVRWNLTTGKIEHEFPIPSDMFDFNLRLLRAFFGIRIENLEYRGDKYVLLDQSYLIDLEKRAVVWRYELDGAFVSGSPDQKTWFCTRRDRTYNSPVFLTTYETPSANVLRKAEAVRLENQLVLYPGMSVRLVVDLAGANRQTMEPTVRQALQESLENRGIMVHDAAPLTLSVLAGQRSTGNTIGVTSGSQFGFGYSPFFRQSEPEQTISQQQMVCRFAITDSSGKVRWFRDRSVAMRTYGFVQQGNAEEQLRKEMHDGFTNLLANTTSGSAGMPTYIFASLGEIVGGESQLVFGGEQPVMKRNNPNNATPAPSIAP